MPGKGCADSDILALRFNNPAPAINTLNGAEAGSVTAFAIGTGWLLLMTCKRQTGSRRLQ